MTRLLLVAAVLVVVLAAAGVGTGAEWDVYPGAGTPIQDAIDGAGAGDAIYVHEGTYDENAMSAETAPEEVWNKTFGRTGSWAICSKPESVDELANKDGANATKSNVSINNTILYVSGKTWYVDDGGGPGIDFTKIQDAVNAATAGDTIIVKDGTYYEQVKLNKQLTIEGENRPIINAAGKPQNYGILIDHTNGCVIRGFEVKPSTEVEVGIYLYYSHSNQIIDNIASNHCYGIAVVYSNDNIANANVVYDNLGGIGVWYSTGNNISSNIAHDNYGSGGEDSGNIGINWANNNIIINNTVYTTTAQGAAGIGIYDSDNCIVTDNIASDSYYGTYLNNSNSNTLTNNTASNNTYGIRLEDSSNNTLTSNTASGSYIGIDLRYSSDNTLTGNNANANDWGIWLYHSSNNTLPGNTASGNDWDGIDLSSSNNNTLTGNTANSNNCGIDLSSSSNNTLTGNIFVDDGISVWDSYHNSIENNTVNGKPLVYLEDAIDYTITNAGQVILVNCNNITAEDLNLSCTTVGIELCSTDNSIIRNNTANSNNDYGIYLYSSSNNTLIDNTANSNNCGIDLSYSSNNTLTSNNVSNNNNGILLSSSSNNTLRNNIANSNNNRGIWLVHWNNCNTLKRNTANSNNGSGIEVCWHSSNSTLTNNIVHNNNYGIYLRISSNNNTIHHNNLINNTQNAYDECTNQWDSGSAGNYYSDYTGTDSNRDGIGETTYDIPGGESVDRYPLTGIRWLSPEIARSRIGINTHWNHWAEDLSIYEEKIKGFGIVRDQAWWAGLETSDLTGSEWDHANWDYSYSTKTLCGKEITYQSGLDNLVKLYQDEDSPELLLLLNLKNNNISSFETITADQYYDYIYHVVERYDRDGVSDMPGLIRPVRYFEVGNEVDYIRTNDSRHGYLSPEDYVEKRLIPAYNAAKAANKDAIVMGSGLGMESDLLGGKTDEFNTAYLEAMYDNITANGGNKNNNFYMDKIAIHYYSENEHPEYFDENIKEVEDVILNKEGREKPIWITEFAPASPPSLYARLLTLIFANRIEMPMIYNLKDEDDSEESFGLYNVTCVGDEETITPRDSIQVIDTVLSTLHGTTPSEAENKDIPIEPEKTIYQRVFNNSDKKVTVLWYIDYADSGAVTNCMIFPESPQTFAVDVLGTADFPADPSSIHLTIGSEPTYVVETDSPIDVDLYFNKTTAAGVPTERATSFRVGDTLYGKVETSTSTDHTVKTYITMTMPDGTCRYAHYDRPDFDPVSDNPLFLESKVPLYDRDWHATTSDWLWNIYEFTGGNSGTYRWNCWYEDAETGKILGGDSSEYTFSETPSGTPVESATGGGEVYLDSSAGTIEDIAAISPVEMPAVPESLNPVYGFFSFNITGISEGASVNIPLAFPENVPAGTEYWKYGPTSDDNTPHWYQIPVSDDDGDRIIVITLTDGGIGDDDLAVNGVIVDDGGPSLPLRGDLNRDGRLTPADAAIALQLAVGGGSASCDPATRAAADVSSDDRVTSLDALMILKAAAGAISL